MYTVCLTRSKNARSSMCDFPRAHGRIQKVHVQRKRYCILKQRMLSPILSNLDILGFLLQKKTQNTIHPEEPIASDTDSFSACSTKHSALTDSSSAPTGIV